MKENHKIKSLSDKYISDLPLDRPSADFSDKIMRQLQVSTIDHSYFVYKPLINSWGWAGIFTLMAGIFGYFSIYGDNSFLSQNLDLFTTKLQAPAHLITVQKLPEMSRSFVSIMFIFSFMALIEITILKKIFNHRFSR